MKKNKKILVLVVIVGLFLSLSGITFAYLRVARKQTNQNELIVLKCLDIELLDEQDDILINNAFAITDEDGKHTTPYTFKIKNKCDLTLKINVNLENLTVANKLEDDYIKVYLEAGSYNTLNKLSNYESTVVTLENAISSHRLLNHKLPANTQMEYKLRLWIDEDTTWNEGKNKSYLGKVVINAEPEYEDGKSSIVLDLNGGESTQVLNEIYYEEDKITLEEPTRSGYLFLGWEVVSGDAVLAGNEITVKKQSSVIRALWKGAWEFDFTGAEQTFVVPKTGTYKLEVWGAQGGNYSNNSNRGGYGGYAEGEINLTQAEVLYINIGGKGGNCNGNIGGTGGYNGGGTGGTGSTETSITYSGAAGGGGATHIAKNTGVLSDLSNNINSIIIISGGGGGAMSINYYYGGEAGGYQGNVGSTYQDPYSPATQTSGNAFGQGYNCGKKTYRDYGAEGNGGGGGGLYGGLSKGNGAGTYASGGGGSGYIGNMLLTNKVMYCYNCATSDEENTKTVSTTCVEEIPTENCAKIGSGYAKITLVS